MLLHGVYIKIFHKAIIKILLSLYNVFLYTVRRFCGLNCYKTLDRWDYK